MIIHSYNSTYRLKYYHVIIHNYARKLNFITQELQAIIMTMLFLFLW